jgi:hypothetical protein
MQLNMINQANSDDDCIFIQATQLRFFSHASCSFSELFFRADLMVKRPISEGKKSELDCVSKHSQTYTQLIYQLHKAVRMCFNKQPNLDFFPTTCRPFHQSHWIFSHQIFLRAYQIGQKTNSFIKRKSDLGCPNL